MEMDFIVENSVEFGFDFIGGESPAPQGDYIPHGIIIPIMGGNAGEAGINGTYQTLSESEEAHV